MRNWISGVAAIAILATACHAQRGGERLSQQCRREVVKLCGMDREKMRECLSQKNDQLSQGCVDELRAQFKQRQADSDRKTKPEIDRQHTELGAVEHSYGSDALQKLDFYSAKSNSPAPLVIFVHGGGWKHGDKRTATGPDKVNHFAGLGYHFASINYRLVPNATVEQQGADVAAAIAHLIKNASTLGIDSGRVVLMGHSAGAHLAALVGTDPQYLKAAGLDINILSGVVPIDGAAYNVPEQLIDGNRVMQETYRDVFGTDPARQKALAPYYHVAGPNAGSFLILHVEREDGKRQSEALAAALRGAGTKVQLNAFEGKGMQGHAEINRKLGDPNYPATPAVDAWLKGIFGK